jgi:hypothetical protein
VPVFFRSIPVVEGRGYLLLRPILVAMSPLLYSPFLSPLLFHSPYSPLFYIWPVFTLDLSIRKIKIQKLSS